MKFFATSYGKGLVDRIEEKAVWRHIRSEKSHITTPQEYSALAKQLYPIVSECVKLAAPQGQGLIRIHRLEIKLRQQIYQLDSGLL